MRVLLYLRTLRRLRWRQWLYRPIRLAQASMPLRRAGGAEGQFVTQPRAGALGERVARWGPPRAAGGRTRADDACANRFTFLNHAVLLDPVDWAPPAVSRLWTFNLHYFDYARDLAWAHHETGEARYARCFERLAIDWTDNAQRARGDAWEPYVVAVRVVNWSVALLMLQPVLGATARGRLVRSLHEQLAFLERRLEWHLLGNHLQKDLSALVLGGMLFDDAAATRWRSRGSRLLWREIRSQVLPDGGHAERSPMYHAIALADCLEVVDLAAVSAVEVPADIRGRLVAMAQALGGFARRDGSLHLFHDAANDIAPDIAWLDRLATRALGAGVPTPRGAWALPYSGYVGHVDAAAGDRFVFDCGEPGPVHQPGHAHNSLLSFELDLLGHPLIVDAGVSGYDDDPLREYHRSTRAHNTVSIDQGEQSELWGTFRLARAAALITKGTAVAGSTTSFRASYRPYHDGRVSHERTITRELGDELVWSVEDIVRGPARSAQSFLHLHPCCSVEPDGEAWAVRSPGRSVRIEAFGMASTTLVRGQRSPAQGWYSPEFGRTMPAPTLVFDVDLHDARPFGYRMRCRVAT